MNSKNPEDWEDNFSYLNNALNKIKSNRSIDPPKLSKSFFSVNFELLQFLYDLIAKKFGDPSESTYKGYEKRIEIIKYQS